MACNCYNSNHFQEKLNSTAMSRCSFYNLAFRVFFLRCGDIPCTHLTTRGLVCANSRFSRAILTFLACMPHRTVLSLARYYITQATQEAYVSYGGGGAYVSYGGGGAAFVKVSQCVVISGVIV